MVKFHGKMLILKLISLVFLVNLNFKDVYCSGNHFTVDDDIDDIEYLFRKDDNVQTSTTRKPQTAVDKISNDFDKFKNKLLKSAELIFDEIDNDTKKYKIMRDSALNDNKKKLETEKRAVLKNLDNLQKKKEKIENIISKIQDGVKDESVDGFKQIKEQCRNKLKTLNDRKSAMIISDEEVFEDDGDDMFRDAPYSQYNLDILNAEITELEKNLANLNHGKHGKLSFAYSQLVDVYKDELAELKRKSELESMNKIESISDIYAKNIESIYTEVKHKVNNLINDATDFIVLSKSYDWIHLDKQIPNVPENAVLGGQDIDKTPLYVIRGYVDGSFKYGKYAFSSNRKHAYLTNDMNEFEVKTSFEVSPNLVFAIFNDLFFKKIFVAIYSY